MAPRGVPHALAAEIAPRAGPAATPGGDRRPDPADGGREPALGAERIRGELGKRGRRGPTRTTPPPPRGPRAPRPRGQTWANFLKNHAHEIWARAFLPVSDLLFRPLFAFFLVELGSRRVVHVDVTRHPTDEWVARQLREATPFDERPRFVICDNDSKYGTQFDRLAAASGIRTLRTPVRAPRANGTCERFLGSVRRERLDHVLVLGERHLRRVLREYVAYFNRERPHQGIGRATPARSPAGMRNPPAPVRAVPILGGLHHAYQRAA